ncbi:uncharacterized protein N7469_009739 [Penicillium citrinum]|uniref:ferric-chelate reductase (NADPH) n=1 Tax=Penicillium citrinum TaxID=5077 RepID=A0A9W9NJ14_PENCI|nr:uncharacterized protein N7469_009739 [Penicillium citrinum]KAJ5220852.1 hypothetical protein N7469_009739 [Penicillium citrinum]
MMAGKFFARASITKTNDAVQLSFRPRRPWKVRAGQYVYLKAPAIGLLSIAESHPFNIIWWENGPDGRAESISILAQVQSGFTKELLCHSSDHLRVLIDGPYGEPQDTEPYDSILMICTGIGISAQLPYAKEILRRQATGDSSLRKQRVTIIWIMEKEYHSDWVCDWMDQLLEKDLENAKHATSARTSKVSGHLKDAQLMQNGSNIEKQEIIESVSQLLESMESSKNLVSV